jgi:hypothetical protein
MLWGANSWGLDYTAMSNQELADLRGAIENAPSAEQEAYRLEWSKRLENMTEEEKQEYVRPDEAAGEKRMEDPKVMGRGYDSQGTGSVIYGGSGAPPGVPGAAK